MKRTGLGNSVGVAGERIVEQESSLYSSSNNDTTTTTKGRKLQQTASPAAQPQKQSSLSTKKKRKGNTTKRCFGIPIFFIYFTVLPLLLGTVFMIYGSIVTSQHIAASSSSSQNNNLVRLQPPPSQKTQRRFKSSSSSSSSDLIQSSTVIVTAYFPIKSKYPQSQYLDWMSTMLSLQDPMIIYTTKDMIDTVSTLRRQHDDAYYRNRTVIIPIELSDLPLVQQYPIEIWQNQLQIDPEKKRHVSYEVFWIWLSKSYFLNTAIKLNPFQSQYFLWSDIGCFRKKKDQVSSYWEQNKTVMIHTELIPKNRMLFLAHHPPNPPTTSSSSTSSTTTTTNIWWNNKLGDKEHFYHSGTFMVGTISTIPKFHKAFIKTIDGFLQRHLFIGDDQPILQSTCIQYPDLCAYISSSQVKNDNHYFGLRSVLHFGGSYNLWYPPSLPSSSSSSSTISVSENRNRQEDIAGASGGGGIPPNPQNKPFTDVSKNHRPLATSLLTQPPPFDDTDIVHLSSSSPLITSPNTVVTAYYRIPSKFKPGKYNQWMKNMLSLQDAMVIFTSRDFIPTIQDLRQHAMNRTIIIPVELNDLPIGQLYSKEFWQDQLTRDPEGKHHQSYELFWIWLSKSWCVSQAIRLNVFQSDLFVWSDIGCFRDSRYNHKTMIQYRDEVPLHEMIQMAHHKPNPPTNLSEVYWNDKYKQKDHFYHSGSQMAAYIDTWKIFHPIFLDTIDGFLQRNMIIVEDQAILQSVCLRRPDLCAYVPFDQVQPMDNHYFGLRYVLHHGGGSFKLWRHTKSIEAKSNL